MGSVVAPIIGYAQAENQRNDARAAQENALSQWSGLTPPSIASQELNLADFQNVGDYQAALEQAQAMGPSAMEGIQTDPRLAQAQMDALSQLSETGQMGMTPGEQAALRDAQRSAAATAQAKTAQIQDNFARQGMGGSGADLAAQLLAAQAGADRASQNTNAIAQSAEKNALDARIKGAGLAGQMQNQQFGQQSDIAKAKDYINQFNTQNTQNVQQRNVAAGNAAALRNLTNKQSIGNQNTALRNSQQEHNKGLAQQQFNNQIGVASGKAGQYAGIANQANQNAGRTADMYAGIGRGIDTGVGAYMNYNKNNSGNDGFSADEESDFLDEGIF